MDTSQTRTRLRSSTLWVPGVLAVVLGVSIHVHVVSLHRQVRRIAVNAVACTLPVDLEARMAQKTVFSPAFSRKFSLRLVLDAPSQGRQSPGQLASPSQAGRFELVWRLSFAGLEIAQDTISGDVSPSEAVTPAARRYLGDGQVALKADRSYELAVEVVKPVDLPDGAAATLQVATSASLKGHPLARWRRKDTALLLLLGASLIALGLSKRHSDRKRRRLAAAQAVSSGVE